MPNLNTYTGPTTKLVVTFDIGTTYSGKLIISLYRSALTGPRFPSQAAVGGEAKVPSLLYYDKAGNLRAAGAEVLAENMLEAALTEGWTKAEWWKLRLRPKHLASSINSSDYLPPLPAGKSAVDVLTDFIRYLFSCAKTYIQEHHLALTWTSIEDSIEYIFTHPNGWEGLQQQQYCRAVERAGLIPRTPEGRSRVHLLTEGEAGPHYCVPNLLSAETADQAPQGVVIIDAGGGTIDLSMFSMTRNPISCEEISPAECRLQGSVFVTRRARTLLQKKLEGWEHYRPDEIAEFTREFDQSTKLVIKNDQEPAYWNSFDLRHRHRSPDTIYFSAEATGLFNDSIDAVISAFEQQQKSATIPITMAFLVGGLSNNDWLWSRLWSYFKEKNIKICRPDNHTNKAVADGAVLSHVDPDNHLVASRVATALPLRDDEDPAIAMLTADVAQWNHADAAKAQQITAVHRQNESLQRDLSAASSRVVELQQCYDAQSRVFVLLREELKNKESLIEEHQQGYADQSAQLASQIEQWKRSDAAKAEELTASHKKLEQLEQRYEAQSAELSSLREQLQKRTQQYEVQSYVQYGLICALPVDIDDEEHIRRKNHWEIDPTGDYYVPGYFESKLRMGANTREEMQFRDPFSLIRSNPADFDMQIVRILCYRGSLSNPQLVDEDECKCLPFFSSRS
ncbi:hypothetical protein OG21DRAFT_1483977 [Imleria badia]|nr:hypothetical protein OG21DRAFT_1483977 [Imleria badia]